MLSIILTLALAQAPDQRSPVAVVVSSKRTGAESYAEKIAAQLHKTLEREAGFPILDDAKTAKKVKEAGYSDAKNCRGGQSCLQKLAVLLGPRAVLVSVDVGKVMSSLAVHIEAITPEREVLASVDFSPSAAKLIDDSVADLTVFARAVVAKLKLPGAAPVASTEPVAKSPEPAPAATLTAEPVVTAKPSAAPSSGGGLLKFMGIGVAALGVASLGTSIAFSVLGLQVKSAYDAQLTGTETALNQRDAQTLAATGNLRFTVALACGLTALALGVVAALLLMNA